MYCFEHPWAPAAACAAFLKLENPFAPGNCVLGLLFKVALKGQGKGRKCLTTYRNYRILGSVMDASLHKQMGILLVWPTVHGRWQLQTEIMRKRSGKSFKDMLATHRPDHSKKIDKIFSLDDQVSRGDSGENNIAVVDTNLGT